MSAKVFKYSFIHQKILKYQYYITVNQNGSKNYKRKRYKDSKERRVVGDYYRSLFKDNWSPYDYEFGRKDQV